MEDKLDKVLFKIGSKDVTVRDLIQRVYQENQETDEVVSQLSETLVNLIETPETAMLVVQNINSLLQAKIKNSEVLVKLLSILNRGTKDSATDDAILLTEEEKKQLLSEAEKYLKGTIK